MKAPRGSTQDQLTVAGHVQQPVLSASTTLSTSQRRVWLADPAGSALTITLPPVSEAVSLVFSFYLPAVTSGSWTLQDQDDSVDWTDQTIDAATDGLVIMSDGAIWWILEERIA